MTTLLTARLKLLTLALMGLALAAGQSPAQLPQKKTAPAPQAKAAPQVKALPVEADRVHVVLLVFGHKGGISAACQKDCKALKALLEAAFVNDPHRLVFHDLSVKNAKTGKVYTSAETLDVVKGLKVGGNDNVVVFQSGHGSIGNGKDPEWTHRLTMDGGSLTRAQIQRPIEALKPRALIFLTDCCSALPRKAGPKAAPEFVSAAAPNLQTVRNLVLLPRGVVSITAAEDGKLAMASARGANPAKAGSAFTVALLRLWYHETTYTNWVEFFPALKAETKLASGGRHAARAFQLRDGSLLATVLKFLPPLVAPMSQFDLRR